MFFLCFFVCGCSTLKSSSNPFSGVNHKPSRSIAVWSPAVVGPYRGFAARVTFFGGDDTKKGVKVDGDVIVYAFEERPDRSVSDNAPDKTYPILAEDLKKLESHSKKLGYSYNIWIPWDDAKPGEAERKDVSLIVKLIPKNTMPVLSGQARVLLPGKEPQIDDMIYAQQKGDISQVSYQFGKRSRYDEDLPPGYRDWTKKSRFGDNWSTSPDEREISTSTRPQRMLTTTIPIVKSQQGNSFAAETQNPQEISRTYGPQYAEAAPTYRPAAYNAEVPPPSIVNNVQYSNGNEIPFQQSPPPYNMVNSYPMNGQPSTR